MDELGHLIYSFVNWGVDDQFSTMDNPKIERYQKLCAKLRMLCCAGDRDATPKQVQDMIYETEFVSHVTYVFRLKPKDFHKTCQEVLMQTIVQVCSIGTAFARGNPKNQHALYAIVEDALWLMQGNAATLDPTKVGLDASAGHLSGDQPEIGMLVAAIFRDNCDLCQRVSQELVEKFGTLVELERRRGGFSPWYLSFFRAVISANNQPVFRNQSLVGEALQRSGPGTSLHLLLGPRGAERIQFLASRFKSGALLQDSEAVVHRDPEDAELNYYISCLDLLVGLAQGHGSRHIVNKPFVVSLFPPIEAIHLLIRLPPSEATSGVGSSVTRFMRIRWLWLLHGVLYDVETALSDVDTLCSPEHVHFFDRLLQWLEQALRLAPPTNTPVGSARQAAAASSTSDYPMLGEEEGQYVRARLQCVDAFFGGPYKKVKDAAVAEGLLVVCRSYAKRFGPLVRLTGRQLLHVTLRDQELLQVAAYRVLAAHVSATVLGRQQEVQI